MTSEIHDLVVVTLLTSLMWVPYILDSVRVRGIEETLGNPREDAVPLSPWASRAKRAHLNAVENLAVFGSLVLAASASGVSTGVTTAAATVYVWARVVHFLVYTAGIPVVRTLSFLVGFGCQVALAVALLA